MRPVSKGIHSDGKWISHQDVGKPAGEAGRRRDFECMLWHYPVAGHLLGTMAAPAVIPQLQMLPDTVPLEAESQVKVERGIWGKFPSTVPLPLSLPPSSPSSLPLSFSFLSLPLSSLLSLPSLFLSFFIFSLSPVKTNE